MKQPIVVLGAGAIGMTVGGRLVANGNDVTFIGRQKLRQIISDNGLTLTRFEEAPVRVETGNINFSTEPADLNNAAIILVCVKSRDTENAGREIAKFAKPGALVVSLQNGISNAAQLESICPDQVTVAGMVGFNVTQPHGQRGLGHFHQGTDGEIIIASHTKCVELVAAIAHAGMSAKSSDDMVSVQWGKLLMNLNNGLNVLSGMPLKTQLQDRNFRRVLAASITEALAVMKQAGIKPAKVGKVAPGIMAPILNLPTSLFRILAANMLKIDDNARSSMADDFDAGRATEIEYLNGEIIRLGRNVGAATPVNDLIVAEVKSAFANRLPPEDNNATMRQQTTISGHALWGRVSKLAKP